MADPVPTPRVPAQVKGLGGKLKGLPPWAYVAAIGVGGAAVWFGINRANSNAANAAADVTGDYGGTLSATTAGQAYPSGSQGAGYYSDPTTGATNPDTSFSDRISELTALMALVGGGTQPSASPEDHYTPPAITINIPDSAVPQAPAQAAAPAAPSPSPHPVDKCKGEFPFEQDNGPRTGMCYKIVFKEPGHKRFRRYANGDTIPAP